MPRFSSTALPIRKTVDPTLRYTKLELEEKTYSLIYDFDAIAQAEDLTGMELLIGVDWSKINARRIRAMLYASMLKAQPEITLEEVGSLITVNNLAAIQNALVETWFRSTKPDRQEDPPKPERDPPGSTAATG